MRFSTEAGVLPVERDRYRLRTFVRNVSTPPVSATCGWTYPIGWRSEPAEAAMRSEKENEEASAAFTVIAPARQAPARDIDVTAARQRRRTTSIAPIQPHTFTGLETLYLAPRRATRFAA